MAYSNRTDLNNPAQKIARQAAPGQTYGEAGQQLASQAAVPMGAPPTDMVSPQPPMLPGSLPPLAGPTNRPDIPLTDNFVSPQPQQTYQFGDPVIEELRAIYALYPNEDLAALLSAYDRYFR